jgi:hypothetical protein
MRTRAVPRPATARTNQTAITQLITGKLETRGHTPLGKHAALSVSLAIMATMPVIPAPIPAPRNIAWPLTDREDSAGEREPDEPVASLASTRLSNLRADPIDQAFGDRVVIVAAKFLMHCCCGSDVIPGGLIHGITLHLKYRKVYDRNGAAEVRRAIRAWPLAWPSPSGPQGRQRSPALKGGSRRSFLRSG